jgi:hypothetical protein
MQLLNWMTNVTVQKSLHGYILFSQHPSDVTDSEHMVLPQARYNCLYAFLPKHWVSPDYLLSHSRDSNCLQFTKCAIFRVLKAMINLFCARLP